MTNPQQTLSSMVKSHSHQDSMVLAQRQKYRSMEENRKPRDKPCTYGHILFDKGGNRLKTISLTSGAGGNGPPLVKE